VKDRAEEGAFLPLLAGGREFLSAALFQKALAFVRVSSLPAQ
jgi:hypothetical protein